MSTTTTTIAYTPEQQRALRKSHNWLHDDQAAQVFQVQGEAGVGKTFIATEFSNLPGAIAITFTAKAASVLHRKGARNISTAHKFLYGLPREDKDGQLHWKLRDDPEFPSLIVVDEVSQIDPKLGRDILSLGVPVLSFGDGFQLPPYSGAGFFDRFPVDVTLTGVHRQALGSPVLKLAHQIRNGGRIPKGIDAVDYDARDKTLLDTNIALCALNDTRRSFNRRIRKLKHGIRSRNILPAVGESVICLRNDHINQIWNGTIWTITKVVPRGEELLVLDLYDEYEGERQVMTPIECFRNDINSGDVYTMKIPPTLTPMTFAYCLTITKAQGSEWDSVVVVDDTNDRSLKYQIDSNSDIVWPEYKQRLIYTAITRAAKSVEIISFA